MQNIHIPILMYHSVSTTNNAKFSPFTVPPARFAEQMAYLSEQGYTPLTVTHYMQAAARGSMLPARPVVLTFDDGFEDFFTAALPVLQRYHFPATLYVATAFVGKTSRWLCLPLWLLHGGGTAPRFSRRLYLGMCRAP